ncbi:C45 family autoproteolytic acyltransferase/hydolase [Streptomyces sp. NPDC053560]|uniref:C45 family autoproteolytic acyltransferase/hydolase n=1 Tax=Streptomyces sp. NPDC053560 TaxID=3365711 RepID=UPI0037D91D59
MGAEVREQELAGLRWLVLAGERSAVFRTLGDTTRADIRAVQDALPERAALRARTADGPGRARAERLLRRTEKHWPVQLAELRELAAGAGVPFHDLLLANLRGDLGTDDGTGCTDLGWRRTRSRVAHNEDGAPALDGRLMLLTLRIDGEAPVTVQWYPGFLPANTFTATGHGLVWGINHLQATTPADAPGRHFVARALQQARTLDEALHHLTTHPAAGGFAYTLGEAATGRVVIVESVAGRTAAHEVGPRAPLQWHTNHLRRLPAALDNPGDAPATGTALATGDAPAGTREAFVSGDAARAARSLGQYEESVARGAVLDRLAVPEEEPGADWFLDVLTGAPLPHGVHRTAAGTDPLMTLCTAVADLTEDRITVRGTDGRTATLPLPAYARGDLV